MTDAASLYNAYAAALNAHDVDGVLACFGEGCLFEDVAVDARSNGLAELRKLLGLTYRGFPDFYVDVLHVVAGPTHYAAEVVVGGTYMGPPKTLTDAERKWSARAVSFGEVADGKIVRHSDYWNSAGFLVQTGALVPTSSGGDVHP